MQDDRSAYIKRGVHVVKLCKSGQQDNECDHDAVNGHNHRIDAMIVSMMLRENFFAYNAIVVICTSVCVNV